MTTIAVTISVVLALATALLAGFRAWRDRAITRYELAASVLVELSVLFAVAVRVAGLAGGHHVSSLAIVIVYLIGIVLVMPVAVALALAEPSRWGSVVIVVGALTVCVLYARINQIWTPTHA